MKFPLRRKLFALTTFIVAVTMATVTYFLTLRQLRDRRAAVAAEVTRVAENIATLQLLRSQDWSIYQDYISRLMEHNRDLAFIAVYDDRLTLRAHSVSLALIDVGAEGPLSRRAEAEVARKLTRGEVALENRGDLQVQKVNIQLGDRVLGTVYVGISLLDINRELRRGVERNVLLALAFVAFSGVLSHVLGGRIARPLERLRDAMAAIALGDLDQRVAPETRDEVADLARAYNDMAADLRERQLIERLGLELGATFQLDRLARLVRERLSGAIGADGARLFLRRSDRPGLFREFPQGPEGAAAALELSEPTRVRLAASSEGLYSDEVAELREARLGPRDLILPMCVQEKLFGLLVFHPHRSVLPFEEKRRRFAATLARHAALALENVLLYEELSEQERLKSELEVARSVQQRLLPRETPELAGLELDAVCIPAHEVGGDYYDFHRLGDELLGIVIADVSGKGTQASLYMAEIKGMMLSLALRERSPRRVLVELNRQLYPTLERHVFASMLYAVLDTRSRTLAFVRAGHGPLLRVDREGRSDQHTPSGIAVGLDPGPVFEKALEERQLALADGDAIVLFTDGLSDAMSPERECFGVKRLEAALAVSAGAAPRARREAILGAIAKFSRGTPQFDDQTLVIARLAGNPGRNESVGADGA